MFHTVISSNSKTEKKKGKQKTEKETKKIRKKKEERKNKFSRVPGKSTYPNHLAPHTGVLKGHSLKNLAVTALDDTDNTHKPFRPT